MEWQTYMLVAPLSTGFSPQQCINHHVSPLEVKGGSRMGTGWQLLHWRGLCVEVLVLRVRDGFVQGKGKEGSQELRWVDKSGPKDECRTEPTLSFCWPTR